MELKRAESLNIFVIFMGPYYKDNYEILYNLLSQHTITSVPGSNIISKNNNYNNRRNFYLDLKRYFITDSHVQTKYQCTGKKTFEVTYFSGESVTVKLRTIILLCPNHLMTLNNLVEYIHYQKSILSIILNTQRRK